MRGRRRCVFVCVCVCSQCQLCVPCFEVVCLCVSLCVRVNVSVCVGL